MDLLQCIPITLEYIQKDFEIILIIPMGCVRIGECIGWIKSYGGQKKSILVPYIPQEEYLIKQALPMHRTGKRQHLNSSHLLHNGNIVESEDPRVKNTILVSISMEQTL